MKDLRCLLGRHAWKKRHMEDSTYLECRRCGKDRAPVGHAPGPGALN